jgi:hypothetical protein
VVVKKPIAKWRISRIPAADGLIAIAALPHAARQSVDVKATFEAGIRSHLAHRTQKCAHFWENPMRKHRNLAQLSARKRFHLLARCARND